MNRDLLSIGVFLIIVAVSIVLGLANLIAWWMAPPLIIALLGIWLLALAEMQSASPQKYSQSAFSLFGWGLLMVALGGAWFVYYLYGPLYSMLIVIVVVAVLAIAAALKRK